ncbi:helicase-2 [Choristoneura occidentalis granulovirus]|uniref:Helicase-2 n=1 Tax=Choristoneura occidentalis granulovirus TaxID=364745 RepID=Q1A4J1_9BBAC|nr:helicase-2 [Choristoneura fumiferana granulovirus]ABC61239.1 helicase-2 [Choristoneura fumiferana granulovirus]
MLSASKNWPIKVFFTMDQSLCYTAAEEEKIYSEKNDTPINAKKRKIEIKYSYKLNKKQQQIFDILTEKEIYFKPVFVSGSAGTGKSALLTTLREHWQGLQKIVYVAAYTHLAARNVSGKTCHSLFGFDFDLNLVKTYVGLPNYLIIDEISMIPEKMLDKIDSRLRQNSGNRYTPFGGVNVIVFGDLYQLPPVTKTSDYLPPYKADVWQCFRLFELTENMRQSETDFINNLNLLRIGDNTCLSYFNNMVLKTPQSLEEKLLYTSLVSTHSEANALNNQCYNYNKSNEEFLCDISTHTTKWRRNMLCFNVDQENLIFPQNLKVRKGTRVMITHTNDSFCNGDLGIVESFKEHEIYIRREHDDAIGVLRKRTLYFNTSTKGMVKQVIGFPITYGWAVTIHKAQGMTLKNLTVHPLRVFVPGQTYVALSRVTHSKGLKLAAPIPDSAFYDMSFVTLVYKSMPKIE